MLISENFGNLLEPGLRHVFADTFNRQESNLELLFNMQTSEKAVEHDLEMGDIQDFEPFTGSIPYDDIKEGYKTNYEHQEFARGLKIERKLVQDDQYSTINKRPAALALGAFRRREADGASVFNNSFNSSVTGGDSLSLCNSAHTSNVGGATQSNTGTSALSPTAVETTRRAMVKFKSNRDNPISVVPDMLIVPVDLEQTAYEIINSKGKVDTAQNNANFHFGKYKLVVWPNYLTSTTRWWMVDSQLMKMFLLWFDREDVQFFRDSDFETLVAKFAGYMRYSFGWSDWRWVFGNNP
jgi:hypothetical protein